MFLSGLLIVFFFIIMQSFLGETFCSRDSEIPFSDVSKCQVVALYFTAEWCPPCQTFTPALIEFYNDVNYPDKRLEIVQVSSDKDPGKFQEHFSKMP